MFQTWTKNEVLRLLLYFILFFVFVLLTQLPGFLSPFYWAVYPVLSAFLVAGPLTAMMSMNRGFGAAAVLPLLWLIVYRCIGELGMPGMWIWVLAVIVVAEIVYALIGYDKQQSIRVCVPILSLAPFASIFPLYFQKALFLQRAAAEMPMDYVNKLDQHGTKWMCLCVIVLALILASVSERIAERLLKSGSKS